MPAIKKFKKIRIRPELPLGLIYGLSSRIKVAFNFPQRWSPKTSLILYLADFHGLNWRKPGFDENKNEH